MLTKRLIYLAAVSAVMLIVLGWQYQIAVEKDKNVLLRQEISVLNEAYTDTVEDLNEVKEQNETLFLQLHDALIKIEDVESRNEVLEQILFNQTQTYRAAIAMQGSVMTVMTCSGFTAKMYERAWAGLRAHGLVGTGEALVTAEERYGVNSLVLASIAYLESGGGMSKLAREKNNLFGLGAGDIDPFNRGMAFSSRDECIYYAAGLLTNSYLSRSGRNYMGDNLEAIGIRYAADPMWAHKVGKTMAIIARYAIPEGR